MKLRKVESLGDKDDLRARQIEQVRIKILEHFHSYLFPIMSSHFDPKLSTSRVPAATLNVKGVKLALIVCEQSIVTSRPIQSVGGGLIPSERSNQS
ncbi:hypothetical protein Ccrd_012325 [Cynara cardunculus var. scolymus]|uniref:Uncharacterized protein n=1 Tax=Cynara cardunculus var. scolymus TaxID=59895 RepID=A0A124SHE3_CYNCS|nr:hypothetical protein Ccrd_012325 [Cynara cardunculus var. scolymus]